MIPQFDLGKALKRALGGGLSGAAAMVLQVLLLMPLRTIMNYQYRFGTSFTAATKTLYHERGLGRYYDGLGAALVQGRPPVERAFHFAADLRRPRCEVRRHGRQRRHPRPITVQFILEAPSLTCEDDLCFSLVRIIRRAPEGARNAALGLTTRCSAAAFRMILTPVDTLKTTLQAQGPKGTVLLRERITKHGLGTLWWGAFATAGATFVGHYPWFATVRPLLHPNFAITALITYASKYNFLTEVIEEPAKTDLVLWLLRLAFIGFVASVVSDSASNSLRVIKTYRQVNDTQVSYCERPALTIRPLAR